MAGDGTSNASLKSSSPVTAFDPYHRQALLTWRNRIARWRADPMQTGFHALAGLVLASVLVLPGGRALHALGAATAQAIERFPGATALFAGALLFAAQRRARIAQQRARANDWFAAQPLSPTLRRSRQRLRVLLQAMAQALLGAALLALARAPAAAWGVLASLIAAAPLLDAALAHRQTWPRRHRSPRSTVFAAHGRGSLWRWQVIEGGIALAPRRLAWLLLLLLLVPRGPAQLILVALLLVGIGVAVMGWWRALAVLFAAQRWLAAQPLPARRLLLGCLPYPLLLLVGGSAALAGLALQFGSPLLAALPALGLPALGSLAWLCAARHRRHPPRAGLAFAVHLSLLLGMVQAVPPLAPLLWLGQVVWLWRRSLAT